MKPLTRTSFSSISHYNNHFTFIEGHRGMNRIEPENTLSSFSKSIEYHLDRVELDIWLTKDKVPVIIHGGEHGEISSTTNGKGIVKDINYEDLKNIRTLKGNLTIPSLEEVLQLCKDKIFINIEMKDPDIKDTFDEVVKLIEKYDMFNQIAISSFKHEYYKYIKDYPKQIEFGFLYKSKEHKEFKPYNFDVKNCSINIYVKDACEDTVRKAHENNIAVMCWCPLKFDENEEIYNNLFKMGIDVLCCNEPDKAITCRNKYYNLC